MFGENTSKKGFTVIEMIMALIIISVVSGGFVRLAKKIKEKETRIAEYTYAVKFEKALKANFNNIVDIYSVATSSGSNNINSTHGWRRLNSSSAFPAFGGGFLTYSLDMSLLSVTQASSLTNSIDENLRGLCYFVNSTGVNINYRCPRISSMTVTNPQAPGSNINPSTPPVFSFVYRRESPSGIVTDPTYVNQTYTFSFEEEFEKRRRISIERMVDIREGLKSFYNLRLSREINNKPIKGLNSNDDIFVPWQWLLMSNLNMSTLVNLDCDTITNGGSCFSATEWVTGSSFNTINMANSVVDKIFKGEGKYLVDGFNNMIHIHLLYNICPKGGDTSSCVAVSPRMPQTNYTGTLSSPSIPGGVIIPPFSGVIFIDSAPFRMDSSALSADVAEYGRIYFVF